MPEPVVTGSLTGTESSGTPTPPVGGTGTGAAPGTGGGTGAGAGGALNTPGGATSTPITLTEDSMVVLPGGKEPVRYGDHYRGFQSEFTRRSQRLAQIEKENRQLKQQVQQGRQQGQGLPQQPDVMQQLAGELQGLTYLNGQQAASVVGHIGQAFQRQARELRKRDVALGLMYKQLQAINRHLGVVVQKNQGADFDSKIVKFVQEAGLPQDAREFASELYVAYEGDDLDQQFPGILKKRWEQVGGLHKTAEQKRIEAARQSRFSGTTRGGNGSASRPLDNGFSKMNPRQIADELWGGMQGQET